MAGDGLGGHLQRLSVTDQGISHEKGFHGVSPTFKGRKLKGGRGRAPFTSRIVIAAFSRKCFQTSLSPRQSVEPLS